MPKGLRIEHFYDKIPKAQSWLVLNLPVFMFVYIHFNVPPTRITDLVRNVSDKKFLHMSHLCLRFCFDRLGLCSVSYTANEYSIYHFCLIIKDFYISFSRVIIVQDFEIVTFYVLFQSTSKHGRRTFQYSVMRDLVSNGQLWARAALRQLRSYKVG